MLLTMSKWDRLHLKISLYMMVFGLPIAGVLTVAVLFSLKLWVIYKVSTYNDKPMVYVFDMRVPLGVYYTIYIEDTIHLRRHYGSENLGGLLQDWNVTFNGEEMLFVRWVTKDSDIAELYYIDTFCLFGIEFYYGRHVYLHRHVIFPRKNYYVAKAFWVNFVWEKYKDNPKVYLWDRSELDTCVYVSSWLGDSLRLQLYYKIREDSLVKDNWICKGVGDTLILMKFLDNGLVQMLDTSILFSVLREEMDNDQAYYWRYRGIVYAPREVVHPISILKSGFNGDTGNEI